MLAQDRLTIRQEAFCAFVVRGESLIDAYKLAGFEATGNAASVNAGRLMRLAKVQAHIGSLKAQIREAQVRAQTATLIVTASTISRMLEEAYQDAKQSRQHGAQVAATMGLAKLHGLLVDKTEDVTRKATRDPDAPIEIDVEHWVTEQSALLLGQSPATEGSTAGLDAAPSGDVGEISESPDDMGLGAPEPSGLQSPETQGS